MLTRVRHLIPIETQYWAQFLSFLFISSPYCVDALQYGMEDLSSYPHLNSSAKSSPWGYICKE